MLGEELQLATSAPHDLVMIDGTVEAYSMDTVPTELADEFCPWNAGRFRLAQNALDGLPQRPPGLMSVRLCCPDCRSATNHVRRTPTSRRL
jgi:hypothetical protein